MRNGFVIVALVILATVSMAAQRVVLFEDFTNSGCGPCWSIEPQINAFISANIAATKKKNTATTTHFFTNR